MVSNEPRHGRDESRQLDDPDDLVEVIEHRAHGSDGVQRCNRSTPRAVSRSTSAASITQPSMTPSSASAYIQARRVKLSIDERQLPRCEDEVPCANRGDVRGQWSSGCRQRATEFDEPLMDQRMCHEFVYPRGTLEVRDEVLRVGPEQFERAPTRPGRSCRGWPLCCE